MASARKVGGRKPGSVNRNKAILEAEIRRGVESGQKPHETLRRIGNDRKWPKDLRVAALKAAAPFYAPTLAAVQTQSVPARVLEHEDMDQLEIARRVAFMLRKGEKQLPKQPVAALPAPPVYRELDRRAACPQEAPGEAPKPTAQPATTEREPVVTYIRMGDSLVPERFVNANADEQGIGPRRRPQVVSRRP